MYQVNETNTTITNFETDSFQKLEGNEFELNI